MSIKCQNVQEKSRKASQSTTRTGREHGWSKCGLNISLKGPFDFSMIKIFCPKIVQKTIVQKIVSFAK